MLALMQLLNIFKDTESRRVLEQWCDMIAEDENEIWEISETLKDNHGIELSMHHLDSLLRICKNGSYKSAFKISA